MTPKPDASLRYFRDVLGMEVVKSTGASVYLRAYGDHALSTLKLTGANQAGVGCIAWRNILREAGIFIETGPAKHNNSQGFYLYTYEPGGNRVEIYSGSFLVTAPDWQPVIWNEAERGTGVYWGGQLPESFIRYATPDLDAPPAPADAEVPSFSVFF